MEYYNNYYNYYVYDNADHRVKDWPFMQSPYPTIGIIGLYIYAVYIAGPRHMENRKPYNLKTFIAVYNLLQVFLCIFLIREFVLSGWSFNYIWKCVGTDYSTDPKAMRMVTATWYLYFVKAIELIETVLFVLRKKDNQVSVLHVYHHISTFAIAYLYCKYIGGSMLTFSIIANCLVHIIMYTYYFMSLYDNSIFKFIVGNVKRYITVIQMVQFILMTFNNFAGLRCSNTSRTFLAMYIPNIFILFYLFYDFYRKSYRRKQA